MVKNIDEDINIYYACVNVMEDIVVDDNFYSQILNASSGEKITVLLENMNTQSLLLNQIDSCPVSNAEKFNNGSLDSPLHACTNSPKDSKPFEEFSVDLEVQIPEALDNYIFWCMPMYTGQDGNQYLCPPRSNIDKEKHEKPKLFPIVFQEVANNFSFSHGFPTTACQICQNISYFDFYNSEFISCENLINNKSINGLNINICDCIINPTGTTQIGNASVNCEDLFDKLPN